MKKAPRQTHKSELKVVFDTNACFTEGTRFVNRSAHKLLKGKSDHTNLSITWCLPEVVRLERLYHLQRVSRELFANLEKLDRQVGLELGIKEDFVNQSIDSNVSKQIKDLKIEVLPLDTSKVDWNRLILDSVYRRPPFAKAEDKKEPSNEKGFRDALIAETFFQLVEASPRKPTVCRIALVTQDERLIEAIEGRTKDAENVYIARGVGEAEELIETLVSRIGEKFIDKAKTIFFKKADQADSLYGSEKILNLIKSDYPHEVQELPKGTNERKHVKTLIGGTRLKKKKGETLFWITRVTLRIEAYDTNASSSLPASTGYITFQITWSVNVANQQDLVAPKIELIEYLKTTWDE